MSLNCLSPEWQIWLVQGIARGCKPADLLRNLTTSGHVSAQRALAAISEASRPGRLPAVDAPAQPRIDHGQRCIKVRGQQVTVRATFERPCAAVLDNLLSPDECAVLRTLGTRAPGGPPPGAHPLLRALEQRLSELTHWPLSNFQPLRIRHSRQGEEFATERGNADHGLSSGQVAGRFVI